MVFGVFGGIRRYLEGKLLMLHWLYKQNGGLAGPNVDFTFAPLESFTISAGTTVRWTNIDTSVHNVASDPEFVGPMLGQNETFTHTFNTPGSYAYYCQVAYHGYTMFGTVTVQ